MKFSRLLLGGFASIVTILVLISNRSNDTIRIAPDLENEVATAIRNNYLQTLRLFKAELDHFTVLVESRKTDEVLLPAFLELRNRFKSTEYLLNYVESNYTRQINGPNLQKAEGNRNARVRIIEPHGLQVIEALLYHPEEDQYESLVMECHFLQEHIEKMISQQNVQEVTNGKELNTVVWDAIRTEIFRIETLGITGFDVPDSEHAIEECRYALMALKEVIQLFEPIYVEGEKIESYEKGIKLFSSAIAYCAVNTDFDEFDRLTFMKTHLHPLSEWVYESIQSLGYQHPVTERSVSHTAKHLFDEHFLNPDVFVRDITQEKIVLGKQLFHDPILSGNNSRSCATCHHPDKGYSDGLIVHTALNGTALKRHTPTLWNVIWQRSFFYDSRVHTVEHQIIDVVHNDAEMNGDLQALAADLYTDNHYKQSFEQCYNGKITPKTISNAIACYLSSLNSNHSRFDKYMRNDPEAHLTIEEKQGFNLFMGKAKCATCHFPPVFNGLVPPLFNETESEILGVAINPKHPQHIDPDKGKFEFTQIDLHTYAFKTPSVRNSAITAPYMHNGRYKTLEELVEFYNNGGGAGQGMNLPTQTLPVDSLHLNKQEMKAIISFLNCLTDKSKK